MTSLDPWLAFVFTSIAAMLFIFVIGIVVCVREAVPYMRAFFRGVFNWIYRQYRFRKFRRELLRRRVLR